MAEDNVLTKNIQCRANVNRGFQAFLKGAYKGYITELEFKDKTALMCSERYATAQGKQKIDCHRRVLADMLIESGGFTEVIHL